MKKNCKQCGKEFEAVRSSAEYCGVNCRMAFSRSVTENPVIAVTNNSVTSDSVTSVTPTTTPEVTLKITSPNGFYFGQVVTNRSISGIALPDRTVGYCKKCNTELKREGKLWDIMETCNPVCNPEAGLAETASFQRQISESNEDIKSFISKHPQEQRAGLLAMLKEGVIINHCYDTEE